MKKSFLKFAVCFAALAVLALASCKKENEPVVTPPADTTHQHEDPTPDPALILGTWKMDKATQYVGQNPDGVDLAPMYGENFCLTFLEDGTLVTSDGINESRMQWTLEDSQLAFIQATGIDPVMYLLKELTETRLVIENGTGTEYVTVMEFDRVTD